MDFEHYQWKRKEMLWNLAGYLALCLATGYLFYESFLAAALLIPGWFYVRKLRLGESLKKKKEELSAQFIIAIQLAEASLRAGYSVENAFVQAFLELKKVYKEETVIVAEFRYLTAQLRTNRTLETLLTELAKRSEIEDIQSFAEVFQSAKRSGGDMMGIIQNTVSCITRKAETKGEIMASISAKRLEQKVMSVVPFGILAYVKLTSQGFLDSMYHNPTGICIMSGCLGMWILAFLWGKRIVEIEV